MRYFTRELHNGLQDTFLGPDDNEFEVRCANANRTSAETSLHYLDYLHQHDKQLTDSVRDLTLCALHDAQVASIRMEDLSVELILDTRNSPMAKVTTLIITFKHVKGNHNLEDIVNQTILSDELYIENDGTFEFSALCDKSEFSVRFGDVSVLRR